MHCAMLVCLADCAPPAAAGEGIYSSSSSSSLQLGKCVVVLVV